MAATPNRVGAQSDTANSNVFGHTWLIVNFAPSLFCVALLCCAIVVPSSPLLELISRPKDPERLSRFRGNTQGAIVNSISQQNLLMGQVEVVSFEPD